MGARRGRAGAERAGVLRACAVAPVLSASDMISVWERGRDRHLVDRALLILAAAYPELSDDELPALTIGDRDARLLEVRASTFGPQLDATAVCPRCGIGLEFSLPAESLRLEPAGASSAPASWVAGDYTVRLRCLDSRDLAQAVRAGSEDAARRCLLERCVVEAVRDGRRVDVESLPAAVTEAIADRMAESDPQADLTARLHCSECGHGWDVVFDIANVLWVEIAAHTRQLLRDVHALARAYGWREADILAMSAGRRQLYLEMVG